MSRTAHNYYAQNVPNKHQKVTHPALLSLLSILVATLTACGSPETPSNTNGTNTTTNPNAKRITSDVTQLSDTTTRTTTADTTTTKSASPAVQHSNPLLHNVSATVYKDPNCGCCGQWINHAEDAGMTVTVQHPEQLTLFKDRYGVPKNMRSCHTTVTEDGYVFEGHIPAKYIAKFLANPPSNAIGLSVPGMPVGSPGMEYQGKFMAYDILQINKDGSTEVYENVTTIDEQI